MDLERRKLGNFGEEIACRYLKNKEYEILDRNYIKIWDSTKKGEIDIIAKKNKTICFVEVKTQAFSDYKNFFPEDKVDFQKQRKLMKLAQKWLGENKISFESEWQIDIISIKVDLNSKKARIKHLKNIVDVSKR